MSKKKILANASAYYIAATEASVTFSGVFLDVDGHAILAFSYSLPFTGNLDTDSVLIRDIYSSVCQSAGTAAVWDSSRGRPVVDSFACMFDTAIGSKIRCCPGLKRVVKVSSNCPTLDAFQVLGVWG
jgi:hypothetical protein